MTMKIIDNSPTYEPCIGKLIHENCAIGQLFDNKLYVLAEENTSLAEKAKEVIKNFHEQMEDDDMYYHYDMEIIHNLHLENHKKVEEQVEKFDANLLMQISTPCAEGKTFLVTHTTEDNILTDVGLMIYSAERIAKDNVVKTLRDFAINNTEEFTNIAKEAFSTKNFIKEYCLDVAGSIMHPTFGMAASLSSIKEKLHIDGIISHKRRQDIISHLLENIGKLKKNYDERIDAELDLFFTSIDPTTWKVYFLKQSPMLQEKMLRFANPKTQAELSTMDLEIRYFKKIDKDRKNDGYYRLFMKRGEDTLMVHFQRKNAFVLYLIYLIDRKKNGDNVDTLDIMKYKSAFCEIYKMTYGFSGENEFDDMVKSYNSKGEMRERSLYVVLHSMREDIGSTCERMRESPEPYLLQDITSHLAVLPKHIIVPKEMMAIGNC